ncbi:MULTISPECIES: hypothetical protein [Microbulbifer]|uniref:hypothetical protein n=1 Tax=Microbulbifer TaxID=48073 RepID=UPI001E397B33|nr:MULTISPECIES: hypothetical protein [Microbulbifer]UHQ54695.1 hypothetical protein LVE68_14480 [Microbulbifer sp. YPW16]
MQVRTLAVSVFAAALLGGCGSTDPRDDVVYPYSQPVPRAAEYRAPAPTNAEPRSNYGSCPGDAEELAQGSICPPTAQCFDISGGKRCIVYEK